MSLTQSELKGLFSSATNECGARYSANRNDYITVGDDYVFTCDECEEPLILVRRTVTYEEL